MKINFSSGFVDALLDQVDYISKDKPSAARKFKNDLLQSLNKDLKQPFNYRKSIYFEDELIRDYIFKGYTIVFKINMKNQIIIVFGFIKHQVI
ncbi:type II toxin-antitoxin system RelE/ParE family toxin [Flavobacterium sp.]|uniref:type II toxin-antitoxin system RelE/ParE family toxin n=1 Tax=Flavobacterium sp. TaxID=239 RepID=UPI00286CE05E|nr:type II toxin-antitoxin system RelE/ParE family toxin [Flavobacterium sp.]